MMRTSIPKWASTLLLAAIALYLASVAAELRAAPPRAPRALLVTGIDSAFHPVDDNIRKHLEELGFQVAVVTQDAQPPKATEVDLIFISSTISPHSIEGRFRALTIPIITTEPYALYDLDMTEGVRDVDYGNDTKAGQLYIYLVNSPHSMGAGLPNGLYTPFKDTQQTLTWGRPGLGATVIATMPGEPRKGLIFGYEKGAMMRGSVSAPARRVMFFLYDSTFDQLNEGGLRLFDAAVRWAAGCTPNACKRNAS